MPVSPWPPRVWPVFPVQSPRVLPRAPPAFPPERPAGCPNSPPTNRRYKDKKYRYKDKKYRYKDKKYRYSFLRVFFRGGGPAGHSGFPAGRTDAGHRNVGRGRPFSPRPEAPDQAA
jgi:hypothetical protein